MEIRLIVLTFFLGWAAAWFSLLIAGFFWRSKDRAHRFGPENERQTIEPPPLDVSSRAAAQRRELIKRVLAEAEIPGHETLREHLRFLPREFLETPPGYEALRTEALEVTPARGFSQLVRLYWQLQRDELLLGERVVDAVLHIHQRLFTRPEEATLPLVRLKPLRSFGRGAHRLPWTVVIETATPGWYEAELHKLSEWLGISVSFAPPRGYLAFGRCQSGAGLEGVVGGVVTGASSSYGMTCSHVLSRNCQSSVVRADGLEAPDAALLRADQPCFDVPVQSGLCVAARDEDIAALCMRRQAVRKIHPALSGKQGFIYNRVHSFPLGSSSYIRFPALLVMPRVPKLLTFLARLYPGAFSRPGDSGAWVFDVRERRWLGMLVGGDSFYLGSYVIEAGPLISFFEALLANEGLEPRGTRLEPSSYGG